MPSTRPLRRTRLVAGPVQWCGGTLAALAVACAATGLLRGGGPGVHDAVTSRGAEVTLYGEGLYAADTWLVGAGNRGQDVVVLLVEVPLLLLLLHRYRPGRHVTGAVLAGILAFFAYFSVSMVLAAAQNPLFPLYVAMASLSGTALALVLGELDGAAVSRRLPGRPGRRALGGYLVAVAAALTLAWLPPMVGTALTGDVAEHVGPYTSAVTEALDLGLVVPLVTLGAVRVLRGHPSGRAWALVLLVVNVCIGSLLLGQGVAQLAAGVPLTAGEVASKMLTFAALTLVAGGLLARMALAAREVGPRGHARSVGRRPLSRASAR